jgi:hypothetical protein
MRRSLRVLFFVLFVGTVVLANWLLEMYGLVHVGFGLYAPAGVYAAGLAFGLRDGLQEVGGRHGRRWVIAAIVTGAVIAYWVSDAATLPDGLVPIAVASAAAFLLSEAADYVVYTPLRQRNWVAAVVSSNFVGSIIDSALFLWLAFGAIEGKVMAGQMLGKLVMLVPAYLIVGAIRALPRHSVKS